MKTNVIWMGLLAAAVGLAGCGTKAGEQSDSAKPLPAAAPAVEMDEAHAPAGVVPGSYEDWCGEHQVPETMCTRCDATLIPAFKAVGDWDEEHGLPKSQCLKCDPDLEIVRPPKPEAR